MKKRWAARVIVGMALVGALVPVGGIAQASTCQVADPTLDFVVCDTVVNPTTRIVCRVVNKVGIDCLA
jgi:hypothetical protein